MSFVPQQNDVDRQVDASMRMFESAQVGPISAPPTQRPQRILVCLDGSQQDDASVAAAVFLRGRYPDCHVIVLDGREREPVAEYASDRASQISGARVVRVDQGDAYQRILAAVEAEQPDLVIVPCPFGREFESVGVDSAGTVIDVLLCRCPKPMLVIRRGDQPLDEATRELAIVVSGEPADASAAVGWAVGMAAEQALLRLELVVEEEQFESLRDLMHVIAPEEMIDRERLEEAMTETHAHLHVSIAKAASEAGLRYKLRPHVGEDPPGAAAEGARPAMIVLPLDQDERHGHGFIRDRIRRSPHPLLVVPTRPGREPRGDCLR